MEKVNVLLKGAIALLCVLACSCTKYNYIDTGVSNGVHDCTMWEYFHTQSYDWDSTIIMIEHAGMKDYFDGTGEYKQITFLGITNHSIRRYILDHNSRSEEQWQGVRDIPVDFCKKVLLKLIIPQRIMVKDVPRGNRYRTQDNDGGALMFEEGGGEYDCMVGKIFMYTFRENFQNVPEAGEINLYFVNRNLMGLDSQVIESSDIQTTNGIVQALSYDFRLTNI